MLVKDRIKEFRRVPASQLMANPLNHRVHPENQRKELRRVLKDIGFAGALLAREQDGQLILLDGHLRADECKDAELPVLVLDVTEEEGNKILASFDALGSMAKIDQKILNDLVESFSDDPFAGESVKEAVKPEDDILVDYEKKLQEEEEEKKTEIEHLKTGVKKFGVVHGDWWVVAPSRYMYCGDWSDPSFKSAINYRYEKMSDKKYYKTLFAHCPKATEHDYRAFESFLDISDECWTFANNDPKLLSILTSHPSARGVFTFSCGGMCQIAVLHSDKEKRVFSSVTNHIEVPRSYNGRKPKKRGKWEEELIPSVGGAIILPFVVNLIVSKFRHQCTKEGGDCVPRFICPSMNTGAMLRTFMGGTHSRVFMAETDPVMVDGLIQMAFKNRNGSTANWGDRPPERREIWITR